MQSPRPAPRKGSKYLDTKMMIVTLSLANTIGLWNLFSSNEVQNVQSASGTAAEAAQPPSEAGAGSPPPPTLVPLVEVDTSAANAGAPAAVGQSAPLRAVAIPTQQIVQKHKPIIGQPVQASNGGGGGGGGSSQPAPVTTTRSSK